MCACVPVRACRGEGADVKHAPPQGPLSSVLLALLKHLPATSQLPEKCKSKQPQVHPLGWQRILRKEREGWSVWTDGQVGSSKVKGLTGAVFPPGAPPLSPSVAQSTA